MTNKTKIDSIIEDHEEARRIGYDGEPCSWENTKERLKDLQQEYENLFTKIQKKVTSWQVNFLIILLIAMGVSFWYMFGGAGVCQDNPFQYGADIIADKGEGDIQCDCYFYPDDKQLKMSEFKFKNKGFNQFWHLPEGFVYFNVSLNDSYNLEKK